MRLADRNQVYGVGVMFPESKTWNELSTHYYGFKKMFTLKYCEPESVEEFSNGDPENDLLRFQKVLDDECNFNSYFNCENGTIQLTLKKISYNSASIMILYYDSIGSDENIKKMMDDL